MNKRAMNSLTPEFEKVKLFTYSGYTLYTFYYAFVSVVTHREWAFGPKSNIA